MPLAAWLTFIGYRLLRRSAVSAEAIRSPWIAYLATCCFANALVAGIAAAQQYGQSPTMLPKVAAAFASMSRVFRTGRRLHRPLTARSIEPPAV